MTAQLTKPPTAKEEQKSVPVRHQMRWRAGTIAKTVGQSVVALCVLVFLLESFLQIARVGQQEILEPNPVLGCWHIPNKLVTWRFEGYSHERFSSVGMRDTEHSLVKPKGTVRIALLGDSATEGLQVSLQETFGKLLEKGLNEGNGIRQVGSSPAENGLQTALPDKVGTDRPRYEVLNFGCSSYSTGQQLVLYNTMVRNYKPDYVVVFYSKGDSLENCLESTKQSQKRKADPRPFYYLDQAGNLQVDSSVLELNKEKLHPSAVESYLRANSCIFGVFSQTNLQLLLHEKYYMRAKNSLANILAKIDKMTKRSTSAPELNYPPQDKIKVTAAIVDKLGSSVTADGGKLIVMTFPDLANDAEYAFHRSQLKQLAEKKNYGFLDLDAPVRAHPAVWSLFLAYHFSKFGHELIADQLQQFLTQKN